MENLLRKIVGLVFVSAMLLSGVALVVVMLNYNKVNPGAPTHAEAKKAEEPEKAEEGVSEEAPAQESPAVEEETKPAEEPTE